MTSNNKFFKNCLKPLSSKRLFKYDFVGFDVETFGDHNDFLMGGLYWYKGEKERLPTYKSFWSREEMIDFLFSKKFQGKYVVATNLDFDLTKLFYGTKYWNDIKRIESGGRLIFAEYKPKHSNKWGSIRFIDTTNYAFFSVEKLGKILGTPKVEKPSTWIKKVCSVTGEEDFTPIPPRNKEEVLELENYNMYDCKISCDFMYFFQKGINEAGGKLCITMASTSFDTWRRGFLNTLLVKEKYVLKDDSVNDFIFEGYYGGRTEAFKRGEFKDVFYYDINSLYPSVMKKYKYPLPNSVVKVNNPNVNYISGYEGVSEVLIRTPSNIDKPFLPVRVKGKLCFPKGTFKGVYNHVELRKALSLGYTILNVSRCIVYTRTFDPFSKFVSHFYNKRLEYKKNNDPLELVMKSILNNLYGKFGQRKIVETEIKNLKELKSYEELCYYYDKANYVKGDLAFVNIEKSYNGKNSFPIIASYVTSYARIEMYEYIKDKDVIYTDTDSIITTKDLGINFKEIGKMKLEGSFKSCDIIKPKLYRLTPYNDDDFTIVKAKGIRKPKNNDFNKILKGENISKNKLSKLRESLKRGFTPYQKMIITKSVNLQDDKRVWVSDLVSKPLVVNYREVYECNLLDEQYFKRVERDEYLSNLEEEKRFKALTKDFISNYKTNYFIKVSDLRKGVYYCYSKGLDPSLVDFNSFSNDGDIISFIEDEYLEGGLVYE